MARKFTRSLYISLVILFTLCFQIVQAQVSITTNNTAAQLAQALAGPGVIISNATLSGSINVGSTGTFSASPGMLNNITSGIVLSSGQVSSIGQASGMTSADAQCFTCDDNDLKILAQAGGLTIANMRDAIILEFDIFVTADTLKFNYVFASDEYPIYVCSSFNDMFGFFISGPGITGPYSNNSKNIALIPGTTLPVGINSVNSGVVGSAGTIGNCTSLAYSSFFNVNTGNNHVFNGYTTTLTAITPVIPCQTYHLKIAIADATDQNLDSGVFLETGSLTSTGYTFQIAPAVDVNYPYLVEGCNDALLIITSGWIDSFNNRTVNLTYSGTAQRGIDYTNLPDSIVIPAGLDSVSLFLEAFSDAIPESAESIVIEVTGGCSSISSKDSILIVDHIPGVAAGNTIICQGDTANISATGSIFYQWLSPGVVSNDTLPNVKAFPSQSQWIVVEMTVGLCDIKDSVYVQVNPYPLANAGNDTTICLGTNANLNASGGTTYSWVPPSGLSNPNIANPIATLLINTNFIVTVSDSVGCSKKDTVRVSVVPFPIVTAAGDTAICANAATPLFASGGAFYSWSPAASLSDPNIPNPLASPTTSTIYTVTVTDSFGCASSANVVVDINPPINVPLDDQEICPNDSVQLLAYSGVSYSWDPPTGLSDPNIPNPVASPGSTTNYTVTIIDSNGCEAISNLTVTVNPLPNVFAGFDQTVLKGVTAQLNGSGGPSYSWSPPEYLSATDIANPNATPQETITYTLHVVDANGCESVDSVTIYVVHEATLIFPSAFSPNNDGLNDEFLIVYDQYVIEYRIRIFNRWGQMVYEGTDPSRGWDGTHNGVDAPVGVYVYVVEAVDEALRNIVRKGNITLIR